MSLIRRVIERIEDAFSIDHDRILQRQKDEFKKERQTATIFPSVPEEDRSSSQSSTGLQK